MNKKPYIKNQIMYDFVEAKSISLEIEGTESELENLYEAKWIYEDMLERDIADHDYLSAKTTKQTLQTIKKQILEVKKKMNQINMRGNNRIAS